MKINTRNYLLERGQWAMERSTRPGKKNKGVIDLQLNLSSKRGGITG
jgi:hypothetical protein